MTTSPDIAVKAAIAGVIAKDQELISESFVKLCEEIGIHATSYAYMHYRQHKADQEELIAELVGMLTELRDAHFGKPVGGGDGGTYVSGHPTAEQLNRASALITRARQIGDKAGD